MSNAYPCACTVNHFLRVSAKFGTCTVVSVNGRFNEDKMRRFKGECAHFIFNKCPIYTHDVASTKFRTNSHETDNCVGLLDPKKGNNSIHCIQYSLVLLILLLYFITRTHGKDLRGQIQRKTWFMGPYAGADYNLNLCPLQSRLQHFTIGNPTIESTLTLLQSRLCPPVRNIGFASFEPQLHPR